jgi:hypothetical protein
MMKIKDQAWEEDELEELAALTAEVIAQKTMRAEWRDHLMGGPGFIIDIELNMEKIYET